MDKFANHQSTNHQSVNDHKNTSKNKGPLPLAERDEFSKPDKKYEDMTPEERAAAMLRMRQATLKLAWELYQVAQSAEILELDPNTKLVEFQRRYPNFAKLYPVPLAYLVQVPIYSPKAFEKMLKKIETNPGKGIEGFNERQADYAKYLYMETAKRENGRYIAKKAQEVWQSVYNNLHAQVKEIKEAEKKAKSEFEEESLKHLNEKRNELRNFILKQKAVKNT